MRRLAFALIGMLLLASPVQAQQAAPKKVIASFTILADIVARIGGDRVTVTTLVPAMGDAHVYQPAPSDARALAQADILIANGLNFESWLDRLVAASGFKGVRIIATDGIHPRLMGQKQDAHAHNHADHDHGPADPHVWHDLPRMQTYVASITAGLASADPANAEQYRQRGAAYAAELKALDAWAQAEVDRLPRAHRKAITQHSAFGYLADRFDIEFLSPQGVTTESEASADGVAKLIRQMKRQRVQALFVENIVNPRLIEQIAKEAKVKIGGRLYSDALSPPGGEADSYVKMYRINVERLVAGMQRAD